MLESGCSIQDVKAVCDPDVLKQIFKWKVLMLYLLNYFLIFIIIIILAVKKGWLVYRHVIVITDTY